MPAPFRFYSGVRDVPLQFNVFGIRISMTSVVILLADVVAAIALIVLFNQFLEGTPFIIVSAIIAIIATIIAGTLFWWIVNLSRMGSLPTEKQFRLLKSSAQLPVWTGIEDIDNNKKEQIR